MHYHRALTRTSHSTANGKYWILSFDGKGGNWNIIKLLAEIDCYLSVCLLDEYLESHLVL